MPPLAAWPNPVGSPFPGNELPTTRRTVGNPPPLRRIIPEVWVSATPKLPPLCRFEPMAWGSPATVSTGEVEGEAVALVTLSCRLLAEEPKKLAIERRPRGPTCGTTACSRTTSCRVRQMAVQHRAVQHGGKDDFGRALVEAMLCDDEAAIAIGRTMLLRGSMARTGLMDVGLTLHDEMTLCAIPSAILIFVDAPLGFLAAPVDASDVFDAFRPAPLTPTLSGPATGVFAPRSPIP